MWKRDLKASDDPAGGKHGKDGPNHHGIGLDGGRTDTAATQR